MNTITWRSMRRYPVRFALAVLAVALGVAFVCGTFTLRAMLTETYGSMAATMVEADATVRAVKDADGTRGVIPTSLADEIRALPGVDDAVPTIGGPVVLLGSDGEPVGVRTGGSQRPGDQGTPAPSYALVAGGDDASVVLVEGTLPADGTQIVLDESTATEAGLSVGDDAQIILGGRSLDVQVVGVVDFTSYPAGATLVGVDQATGTAAFAADGLVAGISVTGAPGVPTADLVAQVDAAVAASSLVKAAGVEVVDQQTLLQESTAELDKSMGVYSQAFTGLAVVSLLVGMFIIVNTFSMTVRQQLRQTAVLRAIGAQPRQVLVSILLQAAVVGVIGSAVGTAAGFGLVAGMRAVLGGMGIDLEGAIAVQASTVVLCLVLGIVISLVSALVPALRSARTPPVAAMRDQDVTDRPRSRVRTVIGAVLLAAGIAGTLIALRSGDQGAFGIGVLALPIGALLLAPAVLPAVLRVVSWPVTRSTAVVGGLAERNATRNPRRSAATATALMIGMTLVGIVSVFAASTGATMRTVLGDEIDSDLILQSSQGPVPEALVTRVQDVPGARIDALRYATLRADGTAVAVGNLTDGAWDHSLLLPVASGNLTSLADGEIAVQQTAADEHGWALGDEIALVNPATEATSSAASRTVTIGAIIDAGALGSQVVVGADLYDELIPPQSRATGMVFASAVGPSASDVAALRAQIQDAAAAYPVVTVLDKSQYLDSVLEFVAQLQAVLYAVLGLALVVALLGIVNLLALSVTERTREIGMLRAVGLSERKVAAMVLVESALLTVFGAVIGLMVGVAAATPLPVVFKATGISVLAVPWGQLVAMLAIAAVAGVAAALWPAVRAARLPVLRAVTDSA